MTLWDLKLQPFIFRYNVIRVQLKPCWLTSGYCSLESWFCRILRATVAVDCLLCQSCMLAWQLWWAVCDKHLHVHTDMWNISVVAFLPSSIPTSSPNIDTELLWCHFWLATSCTVENGNHHVTCRTFMCCGTWVWSIMCKPILTRTLPRPTD